MGGGGGETVWTTDVERFVLTPTGTGVGDKVCNLFFFLQAIDTYYS